MESTPPESYRRLKRIRDNRLDVDRLHEYDLSLQYGPRDIQLLISNSFDHRVLLLEDYVFDHADSPVSSHEVLGRLIDDHELLGAGFWKSVSFIWKGRKFSLVPEAIYHKPSTAAYLRANSGFDPELDAIFTLRHDDIALINVFAANRTVLGLIERAYSNIRVRHMHQSSAIIGGMKALSGNIDPIVYLFIDRFVLHIAVFRDHQFRFYNQYPIHKFEDYLRFLRMVTDELGIHPGSAQTVLYGYLGERTPHYRALKMSIPELSTGKRPTGLLYGFEFDQLAEHHYFDLLSSGNI